ncbi:hypothetical protein Golomagni_02735 [Golovinomyces magnicellulatus]|nr:hypothetical protein Golomagni_02735 [Golovinomyces magnicellulatus]
MLLEGHSRCDAESSKLLIIEDISEGLSVSVRNEEITQECHKEANIAEIAEQIEEIAVAEVGMTVQGYISTARREVGLTYVLPPPKSIVFILIKRIVTGFLKGYDALMNLVLDDVEESMHGKH